MHKIEDDGIGLAELVRRSWVGKQLFVSLRPAVVELDPAPVVEKKRIVLITGEKIGIRPKELFCFGRDVAGSGRLNAWFKTENNE